MDFSNIPDFRWNRLMIHEELILAKMTSSWRYVVILPWFKAPICCISQLHFYLYYSIFWKSHKMTLTSHVTFWFFEKKSWPVTLTFLKKIFSPWLVTWLFDYFLKKDVTHDFDFWLVFWENDRLWQFLVTGGLNLWDLKGMDHMPMGLAGAWIMV